VRLSVMSVSFHAASLRGPTEEEWGRQRLATNVLPLSFRWLPSVGAAASQTSAGGEARQRLRDVGKQRAVMLDNVNARLRPDGFGSSNALAEPKVAACGPHSGSCRHRGISGLAEEGDGVRPVVRDLALEYVRGPPKLGAPDLAGAPRGTPYGGCDAAPELHQRAVVLGRDPMRSEAGEMKHAPEAVAGRPEVCPVAAASMLGFRPQNTTTRSFARMSYEPVGHGSLTGAKPCLHQAAHGATPRRGGPVRPHRPRSGGP
jgi:hypothetical protein